jgi:hypothetical protein
MPRSARIVSVLAAMLIGYSAPGWVPGWWPRRPRIRWPPGSGGVRPAEADHHHHRGQEPSRCECSQVWHQTGDHRRQPSSTAVQVRTPRGVRASTVRVLVQTSAGWSRLTSKGRYEPQVVVMTGHSPRSQAGMKNYDSTWSAPVNLPLPFVCLSLAVQHGGL